MRSVHQFLKCQSRCLPTFQTSTIRLDLCEGHETQLPELTFLSTTEYYLTTSMTIATKGVSHLWRQYLRAH